MTTQSLTSAQDTDRIQPTAEDMAHATPIITLETVLVCTGVTVLLAVFLNVVGLVIGLIVTVLVIRGNARVRRMSIQNAIADRLEQEEQR